MNASVDYSFYLHNWHFFTENAIDKKGAYAGLFGGLLSLTKQLDVGLLLRMLSKKYQSLYATSFTESSLPSNENGFFFCINATVVKNCYKEASNHQHLVFSYLLLCNRLELASKYYHQ